MVDDLFSSSHPLLPPKTEDDQLDWLRLLRSRRVGISTFYRLLAEHGTAQNALEHLPDIAQSRGLAGYRACSQKDAMRELSQGIKYGARPARLSKTTEPNFRCAAFDLGVRRFKPHKTPGNGACGRAQRLGFGVPDGAPALA